jgi:hypothetical protein
LIPRFNDPSRKVVVDRLRSVAIAFVDLQEARHEADYNVERSYTRGEAKVLVDLAEAAFAAWGQIRKDDLARIYLSCFLVYDDWNKER